MTGAASNSLGSGDIEDGFKYRDVKFLYNIAGNSKMYSTPVMLRNKCPEDDELTFDEFFLIPWDL